MSVTRLPVQHPRAPHCAACKASLPTFDNINLVMIGGATDEFQLLAITFHIKCKCGAAWDLKKDCK
jgi:hypothetical protein